MPNTTTPLISAFQQKNTRKIVGDYKHTSMVSHRGAIVSFGMDANGKIRYTVLNLSGDSEEASIDSQNWSDAQELNFPNELSQSGFSLLPNYKMPLRDNENNVLRETELGLKDDFNSSTARLTAIAPFQALSDGKYVYLFRQALPGTDTKVDQRGTTGQEVPIVDSTLLADRFILSGARLILSREIRYQRSRHKTEPSSRKDTLDAMDMDKNPFYEPTRELSFVNKLSNGGFAVLLLPTQETEVKRWQIFYYDTNSKVVNSVSIRMDADGWFDSIEADAFVDQFVSDNGLDTSFVGYVSEQIGAYDLTDTDIVAALKNTPPFANQLAGLEDDEVKEVVSIIRTGVIKDSFKVNVANTTGDYLVETGLSSIFYYQQELGADAKPMKSKASVMLAMGLKKENAQQGDKCFIGVINFAVSLDGHLSRLSKQTVELSELDLQAIDQDDSLQEIERIEAIIAGLRNDIDDLRNTFIGAIEGKKGALKEWGGKPQEAQDITDDMISPYFEEQAVLNHTNNLTTVQTAIDDTNTRINNFQAAIHDLDGVSVIPEDNAISTKSVVVNGKTFSIEYEGKATPGDTGDYFNPEEHVGDFDVVLGYHYEASYSSSKEKQQLYFFKGDQVWLCKMYESEDIYHHRRFYYVEQDYPKYIKEIWPELPNNIDAAVLLYNRKVMFFKGNKYWYYSKNNLNYTFHHSGTISFQVPGSINLPRIPANLDTVVPRHLDRYDNVVYFLKGDKVWLARVFIDPELRIEVIEEKKVKDEFDLDPLPPNYTTYPDTFDAAYWFYHDRLSLVILKGNTRHTLVWSEGNNRWYETDDVEINHTQFWDARVKVNGALNQNSERSRRPGREHLYTDYFLFQTYVPKKVKLKLASADMDMYLILTSLVTGEDLAEKQVQRGGSAIIEIDVLEGRYLIEVSQRSSNQGAGTVNGGSYTLIDFYPSSYLAQAEFDMMYIPVKDDRYTLQRLMDFENNTVLPFYKDQIKPKLEALTSSQNELNQELETLKTGISSVPMPTIEIDRNGLASSGGLLKFAYTADKPSLFDDSLGRVSLFFRGENNHFFAAYFNPTISKALNFESLSGPQVNDLGLLFKPRLSVNLDLNLKGAIEWEANNFVLTFKSNNQIVEKWDALPGTSTNKVAHILNGNGQFILGTLAKEYNHTIGRITIRCQAENDLFPTVAIAENLANVDGVQTSLPRYFKFNNILLIGNKRFEIRNANASNIVDVKAGRLLKSSISLAVHEETHIDLIWEHLKTNQIIVEAADNDKAGIFIATEAFANDLDTIKAKLNIPNGPIKYAENDLVNLIVQTASWREISFLVEDKNADPVHVLNPGLDVLSHYDYTNFTCEPANLSGVDIESWGHQRSLVFNVQAAADKEVSEFHLNCTQINANGQWEAYDPGLAISFDRSLEVNNTGEGETGLLTNIDADEHKLHRLRPTVQGLTLEAWINPRKIEDTQTISTIIAHREGGSLYHLGIQKEAGQYKCFAKVKGISEITDSAFDFGAWKHIAVTYKNYWALKLNSTQVNCGNNTSLSLEGEFAIELLVRRDINNNGILLQKGDEYSVKIRGNKVRLNVNNEEVIRSKNLSNTTGKFYKITLVRSKSKPKDVTSEVDYPITGSEAENDKWYNDSDLEERDLLQGMAEKQDQMMQSADLEQLNIITGTQAGNDTSNKYYYAIWIDDNPSGYDEKEAPKTNRSAANLLIGDNNTTLTFDEIRIWKRALSNDEAQQKGISENKNGLISWWRISEGEGKYIYDDSGQNHGVIKEQSKASWEDSPNKDLPRFELFIDGTKVDHKEASVATNYANKQLSIGGHLGLDGKKTGHFDGILEEIRIWGLARTEEEISDNAFGRLKGEREQLLANYTFDNNFFELKKQELDRLNSRLDNTSSDAIWTQALSDDLITVDGVLVNENGLRTALSSLINQNDQQELIEEIIEIFKTPSLIQDASPNSITLKVDGQLWSGEIGKENISQILSTAPVSTEIPEIRSALSGVRTAYHDIISSSPALVEYGDIQENEDGTLNGILKRCYSYIKNNEWYLVTGYKVGNLITEWYGQAQFDPQVMGFLEGPPPVPGENFPINNDADINIYAYILNNSIAFEQAEEVSYNFSTSKESGYQVTAESEASFGLGLDYIIAPFGFGISQGAEIGSKFKTNWESKGDRSQSFEKGIQINTDRTLSAALVGYDNEKEGDERYYLLDNTGYALVKSKTADIYLLRLEHNQALVSISWRPNPDIPEDTNIISFPINPLYTKQGVLDGKFGEQPDEHYPLAQSAYGEYSYFKPREAYQLKTQIEKEKQAIENYYQDFNTESTSDKLEAAIASTGVWQLTNLVVGYGPVVNAVINQSLGQVATQHTYNEIELNKKIARQMSQRNLVNTYVWTLEGGFYAESTQVALTTQEVYNNNFSLSLSGALGILYELEMPAIDSNQEALFGSGSSLTMTKTKTKESSTSFGLNVSVDIPTSARYKYNGLTLGKMGVRPGTVDAYRFMSFYLEPKPENYVDLFTKVIDQKWLDESPDPNAMALRQARNDNKKPFCWRIMHRVTFVSRILPDFEPEAAPTLGTLMKAKNIESNYMLIRIFDPYVKNSATLAELSNEVDRVIRQKLPEFAAYDREIKEYLSAYYGVY